MTAGIFTFLIVLITAFAVWQDFRFYKKKGRAVILILSGLLLIGFIAEPKIWRSSSARYALLTDGFNDYKIDVKKYDAVYSLRSIDKNKPEINWLGSVSILPDFIPPGSSVEIYGSGVPGDLPEDIRWGNQLQNLGKGLILQDAPKEVETGKEFSISIKPEGSSENDSLVIFKDGIKWHSRKMQSDASISLSDRLNGEGPVTYDFEWMVEDTLIRESWNIRAIPAERLTIGIMTYSPSFETNYLSGHLGERGHSILQRSRFGRDRFRFDAVNAASGEAESIVENLRDLDLLMLDPREFLQLNNAEQNEIKESIEQGLDILMTSPDPDYADEWMEVFSELSGEKITLTPINRLEERIWFPDFLQNENEPVEGIPLQNLRFSGVTNGGEILYHYAGSEPVSIRQQYGNGKITGHLFYQSYSWLIGEKQEIYNQFWADYLSRVITREASQIEISPHIPRQHERVNIYITQPGDSLRVSAKSVLQAGSYELPVEISRVHPGIATAEFWPRHSGWHLLEAGNQRKWLYVYSREWAFDSTFRNYRYSRESILKQEVAGLPVTETKTAVPGWIWLTGFLMLQVVLWAERKIG